MKTFQVLCLGFVLAFSGAVAQQAGQQAGQQKGSAASGKQGAAQPSTPAAQGATAQGEHPEALAPPPDLGSINEMLEGEEDILGGGGAYTYDPGGRRDPFKSLLAVADTPDFRGPRPEGVPGLLIDEVDLIGIFKTSSGYMAQVQPANHQKSYSLREGDQLYDGSVVSISENEVVFHQIVQDPTALKPFRDVVKKLNP